MVTDEPSACFKGEEHDNGEPIYFEMFEWLGDGVDRAHSHPEVMAIWSPMDALCEARGGQPNMEFPQVEPLGL
ncbi:MAG: hypothetical protein NXH95_19330 [Pseudomonadaceae bacterium]|nr:hypothetical protein [Pseudomonadaceae bacterium]